MILPPIRLLCPSMPVFALVDCHSSDATDVYFTRQTNGVDIAGELNVMSGKTVSNVAQGT